MPEGYLTSKDINIIGVTVLHHFTIKDNFEIHLPTNVGSPQGLLELSQALNDLSAIITCIIDQNKKSTTSAGEPGQVILKYLEKAENLRSWIDKVINAAYIEEKDALSATSATSTVATSSSTVTTPSSIDSISEVADELPVLDNLIEKVSYLTTQGWIIDHLKDIRPKAKDEISIVKNLINKYIEYSTFNEELINKEILDLIESLRSEPYWEFDEKDTYDLNLWLEDLKIPQEQIDKTLKIKVVPV